MSVGAFLVAVLAVGLLVSAVVLLRSASALPWPAIVVASLTSAVCFTVGGEAVPETSGPSTVIITGSVAGLLAVVAAALALVPRRQLDAPAPRGPLVLSVAGIAIGAVGLLLTLGGV